MFEPKRWSHSVFSYRRNFLKMTFFGGDSEYPISFYFFGRVWNGTNFPPLTQPGNIHGTYTRMQNFDPLHPLTQALHYLVVISEVEEKEIFKICLEYWNHLAAELYRENPFSTSHSPLLLSQQNIPPRRQLYLPVLSKVRVLSTRQSVCLSVYCMHVCVQDVRFIPYLNHISPT